MASFKLWLAKVWNFIVSIWNEVPGSIKNHISIAELKNVIIFALAMGLSGGSLTAIVDYWQTNIATIFPDVLTNATFASIVAAIFNYIRVTFIHGVPKDQVTKTEIDKNAH